MYGGLPRVGTGMVRYSGTVVSESGECTEGRTGESCRQITVPRARPVLSAAQNIWNLCPCSISIYDQLPAPPDL